MCSKKPTQWVQPKTVPYTGKWHSGTIYGHEGTGEIQGLGTDGKDRQTLFRADRTGKLISGVAEQDGGCQDDKERSHGVGQ
eukprot:1655053-Heterocapsa_arctica.AAC.1